jgi:hypothetical protein
MWELIKAEPVTFQGLVQSLIALATSFGFGLNGTQVGAILAVTAAILSFLTRQQVSPVATQNVPMPPGVNPPATGEPRRV